MPTLTFKATEMKDAKVQIISLVDRAATRIPFKVIKQEKPMSVLKHLDLASVFKKEKVVASPEITGVITLKSEAFESVKGQIAEAGFSVEKADELEDGSVVFGQGEGVAEGHVLIRLSEHAVMAVKSFSPYNISMSMSDGTSFAESCKAQGFYPGVGTMVDVLRSGVLQLAEKSDNPQSASVQVGKMFDEAKQYAMAMVSGLPSKAFKLESIVYEGPATVEKTEAELAAEAEEVLKASMSDAEKTHMATLSGKAKMDFMTMSSEDRAKAMKPMDTKKSDVADPAADAGTAPAADATQNATAAPVAAVAAVTSEAVAEMVSKQIEEMASKMESMLTSLTGSLASVGDTVKALSSRVDTAEGVAKAASEAVSGTVVLGSEVGDSAQVTKSEARSSGREIDTAYLPRGLRNSTGRR